MYMDEYVPMIIPNDSTNENPNKCSPEKNISIVVTSNVDNDVAIVLDKVSFIEIFIISFSVFLFL